jgi:hypothetical protein
MICIILPVEKVVLEVLDDKAVLDAGTVLDDEVVLDDELTVELNNGELAPVDDDNDEIEDVVLELVVDVVEPMLELLALDVDAEDVGCKAQDD